MITDPEAYLGFFRSIHRRTLRDIEALPPPAQTWEPSRGEGEKGWGIAQIVHHICESRMYFSSAYAGKGWRYDWKPPSMENQSGWAPALEASAIEFERQIS